MRKIFVSVLLCLLFTHMKGQEKGVNFEQVENWSQVLDKAKAANKYIFVDCYTTWCKPCKEMSMKVFPTESVGAFMNGKFVSVQVQMDSTANDGPLVKNWYQTARFFKRDYHINAYPTFLVFSPNGEILDKNIGAQPDTSSFLAKIKESLDPNNQYYALQENYNKTKDVNLIPKLVASAQDASESADAIGDDFIKSLKNPFTKTNLKVIQRISKKTSDKGYTLFLHNMKRVNDSLGEKAAENLVTWVLWQDVVAPCLQAKTDSIDWIGLEKQLKKESNATLAAEVVAKAKWNYYGAKKHWAEYAASLLNYLDHYGNTVQPYYLNNLLWHVFLHISDQKILEAFIPWTKKSIEYDKEYTAGMDTYANFLYKLGKKEEAISWEKKALEITQNTNNNSDRKVYLETIKKMQEGVKTWE